MSESTDGLPGRDWLQTRATAQGLVEYGLIIALVAILAIAGLILLAPPINQLLTNVSSSV